jgi:hypothetical protein
MIDRYDDIARESGARIVSFCGHDCVPWDLIVMEIATALKKKGEKLSEVKIFDEILAAPSGGTLETVFHILENRSQLLLPSLFSVSSLSLILWMSCSVQAKTTLGFDPLLKVLRPNAKSDNKTVRFPLSCLISSLTDCQEYFLLILL